MSLPSVRPSIVKVYKKNCGGKNRRELHAGEVEKLLLKHKQWAMWEGDGKE